MKDENERHHRTLKTEYRIPAYRLLFTVTALLLSACQLMPSEPLPTLLPTAAVLIDTPDASGEGIVSEATAGVGENGLPITNTPPPATATPSLTPTRDPTLPTAAPPTETPDYSIEPALNMTTLIQDRYPAGEPITLSGLAILRSDQRLVAGLVSLDGQSLVEQTVEANQLEFGAWQVTLPVSRTISGQIEFRAVILDPDGNFAAEDRQLLTIAADSSLDRYLDIYRPVADGDVVAGYSTFIDGWAERAVNFVVRIAILDADCQTSLARQSYTLRGSGYWQGFIVVPEEMAGAGCLQAHFGEEGSPDRREALYRINVLPNTAESGSQILITNPPPGEPLAAGQRVNIYGTAYRPQDDEVRVEISLDDGSVILSETLETDRWGYWETELLLPIELAGNLLIRANTGSAGDERIVSVTSE